MYSLFQNLFVYDINNPLLFNSGSFFILFTVFLAGYSLIHKYKLSVSIYVIIFSFFFYYKSSGFYFFLLIVTIIKDYFVGLYLGKQISKRTKKALVVFSVSTSLGLLGYYKYANFFVLNINYLISTNFQPLDIFLPIGISFFTFQSISYILDVSFGKLKPTTRILDYAFYLSFFPQLVAGPIVKANLFLPQLEKPVKIKRDECYFGLYLIILGLLKKAVIADYISQYNDLVFADPAHYSGFENIMAVYGYALQIFCDFSGYSDMAIGLGKMMGFNLGVNFRFPYQANNITDFWRRWHISLSTWLKDYLYIPLGGNRKGKIRTYINLFITMLLGGLWHGASWKFVIWGGFHGIGLAVHKALKPFLNTHVKDNIWTKFFSWLLTFHFVVFLWIFFRAQDFNLAIKMIHQIIFDTNFQYFLAFIDARAIFCVMVFIGFLTHAVPEKLNQKLSLSFVKSPYIIKLVIFIIAIQLVVQFRLEEVQPFIYFQF